MGSAKERPPPHRLPLVMTGGEKEYFVTHIARAEPVTGGLVRLYFASERHGEMVLQYTAVIPIARLAQNAKEAMMMAADFHNIAMWEVEEGDSEPN